MLTIGGVTLFSLVLLAFLVMVAYVCPYSKAPLATVGCRSPAPSDARWHERRDTGAVIREHTVKEAPHV